MSLKLSHRRLLVFLLAACLGGAGSARALDPDRRIADPSQNEPPIRKDSLTPRPAQKMEVAPWQIPTLPAATTGGFLRTSKDALVVSAAAGASGPGAFTAWILRDGATTHPAGQWQNSGVALPAWTAAAQWGEAVICAGGLLEHQPVNRVAVLTVNPDGTVKTWDLPALPRPLAGAGAAVIGNTLYVFGGASSLQPLALEKTLWTLDLSAAGAGWRQGPPFPGAARAFFGAAEQYGMLCVFGGIAAPPEGQPAALAETWAYRLEPLEGTTESGWSRLADMPTATAGAIAIPLGQAHVILLGGTGSAAPGSLLDPASPPAASGGAFLFHIVTDAWCPFDRAPSLAAPVAVKVGTEILILGSRTTGGQTATAAEVIRVPHSVRSLSWIDYTLIVAYFCFLAGIGFWFSRKQDSSSEFSLGNRQVKWWAAGISMFATAASAISFMAVPALAFSSNLVWTLPLLTMVPAYFVMGYLIYPLLRRMEITSTYEYLDRRFNRTLRYIASAQCILFQALGRASVVLVLPAIAIASVTGFNVYLSVCVMGVLTTLYTSVGGFEAVIWTEVFQGLLKFLAPVTMITVCLLSLAHGPADFWRIGTTYHKFNFGLLTWDYTVPAVWILLTANFLQFTIFQAGDQPVIQRVFSTPLKEVRRVTATSVICGLVIGTVGNTLGLAIFAYFHTHPEKFDPGAQNDQIVPLFVAQAMPTGAAGVVIAAIFASAMATVASSMNSVATVFTEDFYLRLRPDASDRERLRVLKTVSYVTGVTGTCCALLLASLNLKSMMAAWTQLGALLGGGIVGVYTLGMFTKRTNGFGAVCGAIASIVVTLLVKLFTPIHWSAYPPIAILSCILVGYALSFLGPQTRNLEGLTVYTPKPPPVPV